MALLSLKKTIILNDYFLLSFSVSAWCFAFADFLRFKPFIDDRENETRSIKVVNNVLIYVQSQIGKLNYILDILAIMSLIVLPHTLSKMFPDLELVNSFMVLMSMALILLMIGFRDKKKEMIQSYNLRKKMIEYELEISELKKQIEMLKEKV
ncbi:bZIP transcription factor [Paenibacillus xylanivorans]|nr:bZIP transcription factor [Paenibacillus xylanivorans]